MTKSSSTVDVSELTIRLYDPSGVYTDAKEPIDITRGLKALRAAWITEREDTEQLPGISSAYGQQRLNDPQLQALRIARAHLPRRARAGGNVSQMHYARKGIITPEVEFIVIRENLVREFARLNPASTTLQASTGVIPIQQVSTALEEKAVEFRKAGSELYS